MPDDQTAKRADEPSERSQLPPDTSKSKTSRINLQEGWYVIVFVAGLAGWVLLALITWNSIN
jgi:hypothetical protein